MRALKALVIGMGVMIVGAVLLLAFGLYKKSVDPTWKLFGKPHAVDTAPAAPIQAFDDVSLGLPEGCRIMDASSDGGSVVFVRIGPDASCDQVIAIDLGTGKVLGRINPR